MVRDNKSVGEMLMNSFTKTTTVLPRFGYIMRLQSASNIASRFRLRSSRNYCSYECNISYADIVCSILHKFVYSKKMV